MEQQGCSAEDWNQVLVSDEQSLKYIRGTRFSGDIRLGSFRRSFEMPGGIHKHTGIFNASLHDVTIGDDCCIENIKNYIAILCDGPTSFGNGVEVCVLNETGGREVTIHDRMSAHEAYLEAFYRHRPEMIAQLKRFAADRVAARTSMRGTICSHCTIVDTGYVKNVYMGPYAKVEGAGRLKNGTLNSRCEAPVHVGYGVICDDFIIQDGSKVEDCTTIERVYVGQACVLGHGYSASDSLFFCIVGAKKDGHEYARQALLDGAAVLVVQKDLDLSDLEGKTPVEEPVIIRVQDTRYAMAYIAAAYYGDPASEMKIIGVTGTKGKTTTTYMVKSILEASGIRTGLIGTIEILYGDVRLPAPNTTPESTVLQKTFRDMADAGIQAVVMEVSSQALKGGHGRTYLQRRDLRDREQGGPVRGEPGTDQEARRAGRFI